jgi:hypothetical protein
MDLDFCRGGKCKVMQDKTNTSMCFWSMLKKTIESNTLNVLVTLHLRVPPVWQSFVGQPIPWPGVTATQTAL